MVTHFRKAFAVDKSYHYFRLLIASLLFVDLTRGKISLCYSHEIHLHYNNTIYDLNEFICAVILMQFCFFLSRKAMSVPHGSEQKTENANDKEDWLHNARKQLIPNKVDWSVCITLFFLFLLDMKSFLMFTQRQ